MYKTRRSFRQQSSWRTNSASTSSSRESKIRRRGPRSASSALISRKATSSSNPCRPMRSTRGCRTHRRADCPRRYLASRRRRKAERSAADLRDVDAVARQDAAAHAVELDQRLRQIGLSLQFAAALVGEVDLPLQHEKRGRVSGLKLAQLAGSDLLGGLARGGRGDYPRARAAIGLERVARLGLNALDEGDLLGLQLIALLERGVIIPFRGSIA